MSEMDDKLCEGCRTYYHATYPTCLWKPVHGKHTCPCVTCILKPVCNMTCDLYGIYLNVDRYT